MRLTIGVENEAGECEVYSLTNVERFAVASDEGEHIIALQESYPPGEDGSKWHIVPLTTVLRVVEQGLDKLMEEIEYVVDINPYKHGKSLPGTGQEIVSPQFLTKYNPQKIIVMNPVYLDEIQRDIERLGIKADLFVV